MTTIATALRDLHQLQLELADVRSQIQRGPLQVKGKEAESARKLAAIKAARDELKKLKMAADQKELSLKSGEQKVRDLEVKRNLCQSNKEFTAIADEIKTHKEANGALEEEILELITGQEEIAKAIAALEQESAELQVETARLKELIGYKVEKLTQRLVLLESKIDQYEGQLDSTTLSDYRRLFKGKGCDALAACVEGNCSACYMAVTPQNFADLSAGRVVICKSCGAILYFCQEPLQLERT